MKRYGKAFVILKKELENKSVQKKSFKNSEVELYEYWIYQEGKSTILDATGKKVGDGDFKLRAIIACEHNSNHIKEENDKTYLIEGLKFTNDKNGNDLDEYLSKTGRK